MAIWSAEIKELEKLHESFKGQFSDLEKELERLIKADDENMILLYSRRCLEVIITDLCESELKRPRKTEPLKGIIDKLHKEEKIPSNIITSMDHLNSLSAYGAHPKDFDPEQVKPVLVNLDIIIKWYLKFKQIVTIGRTEIEEEKTLLKEKPLEEVKKETKIEEQEKPVRLTKHMFLSGLLISTVLVIAAILAYPKIFKQDKLEKLRSSGEKITVAVMPFQNMTNDTTKNFWQEMVQDNLITSLSNAEELEVRQTESISSLLQDKNITNYASLTPSISSNISQKLDANVFVHGSINQIGTIIRLNAKLVDSKTEEIIKSYQKDGTEKNILGLIDTLSSMVKDYLVISKLKSGGYTDFEPFISTNSPQAYKFFIYGENERRMFNNKFAIKYYSQAIDLDSNFAYAVVMLSYSFINLEIYDQPKSLCMKVYNKGGMRNSRERIWLDILHAYLFETPFERITYLRQLQRIDSQNPIINFQLGYAYFSLSQHVNAIHEYENALKIYKKWRSKPYWVLNYTNLGYCYHLFGQFRKEKQLYKKAEKDFPDNSSILYRQCILALSQGRTKDADEYIEKYISDLKELAATETAIATTLGDIYSQAGVLDKAEEYYRQALSLEPENSMRLNNLAYFLINKDRNINEGLQLVDNALKLNPDSYNNMYTKGWGLYKQGNYQEALEILQKSWDIRKEKAVYDHEAFLHLEAAKKAVAGQKNN